MQVYAEEQDAVVTYTVDFGGRSWTMGDATVTVTNIAGEQRSDDAYLLAIVLASH